MAKIAYVRMSVMDLTEDLEQMDAVFTEKGSAKGIRPELEKLFEHVKEGDTVYVQSFSVLAATTADLFAILKELQKKGVHVVSRKENMDTCTEDGKIMLGTIAAIAEFEKDVKYSRLSGNQDKRGKHNRKKKIVIPEFKKYYDLYMKRGISKSGIALELNISRPTVDRLVREYEESIGKQ